MNEIHDGIVRPVNPYDILTGVMNHILDRELYFLWGEHNIIIPHTLDKTIEFFKKNEKEFPFLAFEEGDLERWIEIFNETFNSRGQRKVKATDIKETYDYILKKYKNLTEETKREIEEVSYLFQEHFTKTYSSTAYSSE